MAVYISFVVISALLLWAVIYARGPWAVKLALIFTVPVFGVVVWHSLESYRGWPANVSPPADASMVAQYVDEPNAIYLWLIPPGEDKPRAYRIPYTRAAHEQAAKAQEIAKRGGRAGFRKTRGVYVAYQLPPPLPPKSGDP